MLHRLGKGNLPEMLRGTFPLLNMPRIKDPTKGAEPKFYQLSGTAFFETFKKCSTGTKILFKEKLLLGKIALSKQEAAG